jgi:hypothetical protein
MMRCTVVWDPEAENALAETWIVGDSNLRSALAAIADWLDKNLSEDPDSKGQFLPERSARIIAVPVSVASA